jgi:hypothetical protein
MRLIKILLIGLSPQRAAAIPHGAPKMRRFRLRVEKDVERGRQKCDNGGHLAPEQDPNSG